MAVEFSLRDIVTSLENGDSGAYIKDIITNKMWSFLFFYFFKYWCNKGKPKIKYLFVDNRN